MSEMKIFLFIATGILAFTAGTSDKDVATVGLNAYSLISESVSAAPDGAVITGSSSSYGGAVYTTGNVNIEGSVKVLGNTCTGFNKNKSPAL